jgi:nucleotidyltransferase/DNA polymerase involved in DNA repair
MPSPSDLSRVRIARMAKQKVFETSKLLCSIGVSGDKTTTRFVAKLDKPGGLAVIPPWHSALATRAALYGICARVRILADCSRTSRR